MARKKSKEVRINALVKKTKVVFHDCLLPNGCLVAAPTHMPYYPHQAKNYLYCWPGRDLGFTVTAGLDIGIDVFEDVLAWIWARAEDYRSSLSPWKEGLLFENYHPNGRMQETDFQPDQTGTLLWAIYEYGKDHDLSPLAKKIVEKSTKGLVGVWAGDQFKTTIEDLWEERIAHPRFQNNLTYALAACAAGLERANDIVPNRRAKTVAKQMRSLIEKEAYDERVGYFTRRFGGPISYHKIIDASMLGLIWPFAVVAADDPRMAQTVDAIEAKITDGLGLYRYQFDHYEGEIEGSHVHYKMGAGAWPLLTFWMSIVQSKMGNRKEAEEYFWLVLDQLGTDLLIPEQIFPKGDPRVGVKPLLWSHAMFVHAAKELGYI